MERSDIKVIRKGYVPVLVGKEGDGDEGLMEKLYVDTDQAYQPSSHR